jgi:hypothetical protein
MKGNKCLYFNLIDGWSKPWLPKRHFVVLWFLILQEIVKVMYTQRNDPLECSKLNLNVEIFCRNVD